MQGFGNQDTEFEPFDGEQVKIKNWGYILGNDPCEAAASQTS